ncbi:MAG: Cyclohexadienyl dehydratase [Labilithrix sp.]|nr:Cyclohexadienyl dehydratase [Labilithrix sp.]
MTLRLLFALLFALLLSLVAGACTPPPSPIAPPKPAAGAAVHAQLRAGTSGEYPPLSLWNGGRALGFAPALVTSFAASQKMQVGWTQFGWPGLSADLRAGKFDLAADGITVRPERSIAGRFTVPIARGGAVLLLRRPAWAPAATDGATGLSSLSAIDRPALRVVVNQGGHLERVARGLLHAADLRAIPDNDAVRAAFARGEADAAMTNTFEAPRWATGIAGVEQLGPLTEDVTAIWVRADREDLAGRLDEFLIDEEESGRLGALRAKWLGPGAGPRAALPVSALLAATAERLALMPFVAAAKQRTGKAVEDAAQEERVIAASAEAVAKSASAGRSAPPARASVDAFFRAQIDAAKAVQRRVSLAAGAPAFSLDEELRPAIARISARMAFLVVRIPRGTTRAGVAREAREALAGSGLEAEDVDRIAAAIAALGGDAP